MYTLYGFPFSQHSRRVVSLLEAAHLPYTHQTVDMMSGEHMSDDYLRLNPNHQVPTLLTDDGPLYESNAILRYLCNAHQLDDWYPTHASQRGRVDQWLDWIQCQMSPAVINIVLNSVFMGDKGDPKAIAAGHERMTILSALLDHTLCHSPYIAGDTPTIADLALVSNVFQLSLADAVPSQTHIQRWYDTMLAMEAVQRSLPD